jgi:hypothetical protein
LAARKPFQPRQAVIGSQVVQATVDWRRHSHAETIGALASHQIDDRVSDARLCRLRDMQNAKV